MEVLSAARTRIVFCCGKGVSGAIRLLWCPYKIDIGRAISKPGKNFVQEGYSVLWAR